MNIGEVSKLTGISSSNIRYYEELNLIHPKRNKENDYRLYEQEDVNQIEKIILLRKLDVSLEDIRNLFEGEISLEECLDKHLVTLHDQSNALQIRKKLSQEIKDSKVPLTEDLIQIYLEKIKVYEKEGIQFMDVASDVIDKIKKFLPQEASYYFDPKEPILTKEQFTDELFFYAKEKGLDMAITKESMQPSVMINNKSYTAVLEMPRMFKFPFSIFFAPNTFGYKMVYLYEVQ